MSYEIFHGDNRDVMFLLMADNSVDAIVCDPPYELGFMGKSWDASGIAYDVDMWREALRVLKPGGHLLAFSGSRTYHRMTVAIEDAGFEIRDQIMWVYGSGFPKSLDVSKAIDKAAGAEREVTRAAASAFVKGEAVDWDQRPSGDRERRDIAATAAAAAAWQGWGTALKPAHEPICVARKPLMGTVAANVLAHGTGALNIDGCRVEGDDNPVTWAAPRGGIWSTDSEAKAELLVSDKGRWPANFIHGGLAEEWSRFFYCPKASKSDRDGGLESFAAGRHHEVRPHHDGGRETEPRKNTHPTVKPTELMRYLVRLVTPPGGVVLDPFMGSGSTGKAAVLEGFRFVGIDVTPEYVAIARARIEAALYGDLV